MIYTVSEDVEITLDSKKYLLEAGDQIVVEDLNTNERQILTKKFGPVNSAENYWATLDAMKKYLAGTIRKAMGVMEEKPSISVSIKRKIEDVKDFMDNHIDEFVISMASPEVAEEINQDKIARIKETEQFADFAASADDYKREKEQEHIKAFGETPKQAVERLRKEREKVF